MPSWLLCLFFVLGLALCLLQQAQELARLRRMAQQCKERKP